MMKRFVTISIALSLSALFIGRVAATPLAIDKPVVLTLKDAVLLSIRNNPDLEQAEVQQISNKFALVVAKYQFQPQYTLTASNQFSHTVSGGSPSSSSSWGVDASANLENHYGTEFSVSSSNPISNGTYNPELVLKVVQPLIRGFGKAVVDATLDNARDTLLTQRLTFKSTAIATVTNVINDYLSLVNAYQTLAADKQTLANYQRTVVNDKEMIAAGRMARSDIVQAKAQVETQLATIQNDLNTIDVSKNQLLNDLGLPPRTPITIPSKFDFKKVENEILGGEPLISQNASTEVALANNISYQTAVIAIRILRRSLLVAKDNRRWQLDLTASETMGGGSGGSSNAGLKSLLNGSNHDETVGLDLTVPVDDVNSQAAVIDQEVGLDKALIALEESKRSLIESVETDYDSVISNKKSLKISLNALKLQKETVYIAEQKQLAGRVSTFEVLTDQRNLATQYQTVVDNEINYLKSIITLEQDIGSSLEPWHIRMRY